MTSSWKGFYYLTTCCFFINIAKTIKAEQNVRQATQFTLKIDSVAEKIDEFSSAENPPKLCGWNPRVLLCHINRQSFASLPTKYIFFFVYLTATCKKMLNHMSLAGILGFFA